MTATTVPFARTINPGDTGPDVEAVKRALVKWKDAVIAELRSEVKALMPTPAGRPLKSRGFLS